MPPLDVLRTEKKYPLGGADLYRLSARLKRLLPLDSHCAGGDGYLVRSLYFDSPEGRDYFEKDAGVECRRKIRLRTYGGTGPVKLEWKQKQGALQHKRSLLIRLEDARNLVQGRYRCLLDYPEELAGEFYTHMTAESYRPCCVVQYRRLAFAVPMNDTRVTLDSDIRSHEGVFDLFSYNPPLYPVSPAGRAVLEIKYNHFLVSYVGDIVAPFSLLETAASKYCASRRFGLGGTTL